MSELTLHPVPLTAKAFQPFGDVIAMADHDAIWINEGTSQRYNDLAELDVQEAGGRPLISIFHALPRVLPLPIEIMERHPLSSQAFYPLERRASDCTPFSAAGTRASTTGAMPGTMR